MRFGAETLVLSRVIALVTSLPLNSLYWPSRRNLLGIWALYIFGLAVCKSEVLSACTSHIYGNYGKHFAIMATGAGPGPKHGGPRSRDRTDRHGRTVPEEGALSDLLHAPNRDLILGRLLKLGSVDTQMGDPAVFRFVMRQNSASVKRLVGRLLAHR